MSDRHPIAVQQCRATSKGTGKQCGRSAIPGGTVCRYHGGAAPQVQAKARERLAELVHPAIVRLGKLVDAESEGVALGAVKDVLDRNGLTGKPGDGDAPGVTTFTLNIGIVQHQVSAQPFAITIPTNGNGHGNGNGNGAHG